MLKSTMYYVGEKWDGTPPDPHF